MRTTRGLVASLGASLSLVVAGTLVLVTFSTIVAFHGWPGVASSSDSGSSSMLSGVRAATREPQPRAARAVVLPTAAGPAVAVRRSAPTRRQLTSSRGTVGHPRPGTSTAASRPPSAAATPDGSSAPAATPAATSSPARPAASVPATASDAVRKVGKSVGSTVSQTTHKVSTAVAPVSPAVSTAVDKTGQAVDKTVQGVTGGVANTVDAVTKKTQP